MERYWGRVQGIRQEIADGIGDPQVRDQVETDFATAAGVKTALVERDVLLRRAEQGRRDLGDHLTLYGDIADAARHPARA
jgi:hypothetical protein